MKTTIMALVGIVLCSAVYAQGPDTVWTGLYGDKPGWDGYDQLYGATPTYDGGFAMNGYSSTYGDTIKGDQWVVKIDANGDTMWTATCGAFDRRDYGRDIIESYDDCLIVCGHGRIATTTEAYRIRLFKLDSLGNQIWERDHVAADGFKTAAIVETADLGFAITGSNDQNDIFLFRADSLGDSLWAKTYGGAGDDVGYDVCQTSDDGFLIVGATDSYGAGSYDVYVIKTDATGDTLWTRTYGGVGYDEGRGICRTSDGHYMIAGHHYVTNSDIWLIKMQETGDTLWSKTPGRDESNDVAYGITAAPDNGFLLAGRYYNPSEGDNEMYVMRVDANGDSVWSYYCVFGAHDEGRIAYQAGDGKTYLFGTRAASSSGQYRDYWAVAFAPLSNADDDAGGALPADFALSQNYPNPFNPATRIEYSLAKRQNVEICVYDLLGRKVTTLVDGVKSAGEYSVVWDGCDDRGNRMATGIYFYRLRAGGNIETRKMMLLK